MSTAYEAILRHRYGAQGFLGRKNSESVEVQAAMAFASAMDDLRRSGRDLKVSFSNDQKIVFVQGDTTPEVRLQALRVTRIRPVSVREIGAFGTPFAGFQFFPNL